MSIICGNYGFATAYAEFTNDATARKNYRIVKEVWSGEFRISRNVETISVSAGQTVTIYESASNFDDIILRAFRQDYEVTGEYTETRVVNETFTVPMCPIGPR